LFSKENILIEFIVFLKSLAQKIDENLKEKIGLIKEVYSHLREEFDTINSIQLKLLSENEDTQKQIVNHYKFQVYLSGKNFY